MHWRRYLEPLPVTAIYQKGKLDAPLGRDPGAHCTGQYQPFLREHKQPRALVMRDSSHGQVGEYELRNYDFQIVQKPRPVLLALQLLGFFQGEGRYFRYTSCSRIRRRGNAVLPDRVRAQTR